MQGYLIALLIVLFSFQLLLDTHSLKTVLLDLPSLGSTVHRKAPARCVNFKYEPRHDKTNKMSVPSEDSDQPGHPPIRCALSG